MRFLRLSAPALALWLCGQAWGLDVLPEALYLRGVPGEQTSADLAVVNNSSYTAHVRLDSSERWLRTSPRAMSVPAGSRRVAQLRARVPEGLGEISAEVRVHARLGREEFTLARPAFLWRAGTELFDVRLASVAAEAVPGGVEVKSTLENRGNVSLRARVMFEVETKQGAVLTEGSDIMAKPLAPAGSLPVAVHIAVATGTWSGWARVSAFYRDAEGKTQLVHEAVGSRISKP